MSNNTAKLKPTASPMYPTAATLDEAYAIIKAKLPIENSIELKAAIMLYHNTLLKELSDENHIK